MIDKRCLITGASSGIGKAVALQLAEHGYHIIMVCRDVEKGQLAQRMIQQQSGNSQVDLLLADISSQTSIRCLAEQINTKYRCIDVLINNAGVVLTQKKLSIDRIELTLATNFLGPFLLTNSLLPKLYQSNAARIINISSEIHRWNKLDINDLEFDRRKYKTFHAYAQSKILMNMYTFKLAQQLKDSNITVNALHPGAVRTQLGSQNANNTFLKLLDKFIKIFFITPNQAANAITYLAIAPELKQVTGKYFVKDKQKSASSLSRDLVLSNTLWSLLSTKFHLEKS